MVRYGHKSDKLHLNETQLAKELTTRGLKAPNADMVRKKVTEWDEASGAKRELRIRCSEIFTLEVLKAYILRKYGMEIEIDNGPITTEQETERPFEVEKPDSPKPSPKF